MVQITEHRYIVRDEHILSGEPIIKGTRTSVRALTYAVEEQRVLLTHNRSDFESLVQTYFDTQQKHYGVIFATNHNRSNAETLILSLWRIPTSGTKSHQLGLFKHPLRDLTSRVVRSRHSPRAKPDRVRESIPTLTNRRVGKPTAAVIRLT